MAEDFNKIKAMGQHSAQPLLPLLSDDVDWIK